MTEARLTKSAASSDLRWASLTILIHGKTHHLTIIRHSFHSDHRPTHVNLLWLLNEAGIF